MSAAAISRQKSPTGSPKSCSKITMSRYYTKHTLGSPKERRGVVIPLKLVRYTIGSVIGQTATGQIIRSVTMRICWDHPKPIQNYPSSIHGRPLARLQWCWRFEYPNKMLSEKNKSAICKQIIRNENYLETLLRNGTRILLAVPESPSGRGLMVVSDCWIGIAFMPREISWQIRMIDTIVQDTEKIMLRIYCYTWFSVIHTTVLPYHVRR